MNPYILNSFVYICFTEFGYYNIYMFYEAKKYEKDRSEDKGPRKVRCLVERTNSISYDATEEYFFSLSRPILSIT